METGKTRVQLFGGLTDIRSWAEIELVGNNCSQFQYAIFFFTMGAKHEKPSGNQDVAINRIEVAVDIE